MEILPTLISVIVGAFATGVVSIWLTKVSNRNQQQQELQSYRKSLMQQYLACINQFDLILNQLKQHVIKRSVRGAAQSQAEELASVLSQMNDLRALVLQASSILKATGDIGLFACGWMLSEEALSNVDKDGISFNGQEYNPIHYFRVALDVGLQVFAQTISNNLPPSHESPDMRFVLAASQTYRQLIRNKYKENPDWMGRLN